MRQIAHQAAGDPVVKDLACRILLDAGIPSHYYADEARAIGRYVQAQVRYLRDPDGYEQLRVPDADFLAEVEAGRAQGDCDDMALLTASLLLSIGHNPYFRMVRYEGQDGAYAHIYTVDYDSNPGQGRQRVVLDCILKDRPIGSEVDHASGDEVEV